MRYILFLMFSVSLIISSCNGPRYVTNDDESQMQDPYKIQSQAFGTEFEHYKFIQDEMQTIYVKGKYTTDNRLDYVWVVDNLGSKLDNIALWVDGNGWFSSDNIYFTVPLRINTLDLNNGNNILTIHGGPSIGTTTVTFICTVSVHQDRKYNVYYTYIKNQSNSQKYDVLESPPTSPVFVLEDEIENIFEEVGYQNQDGVDLSILGNREITSSTINIIWDNEFIPVEQKESKFREYYNNVIGSRQSNEGNYIEFVGFGGVSKPSSLGYYSVLGYCSTFDDNQDGGAMAFIASIVIDAVSASLGNTDLIKKQVRAVAIAHELGHLRDYKAFYPSQYRVWLSNHVDHNGTTQNECIMRAEDLNMLQQQIDKLSFCDGCSQKLLKINWSPLLKNLNYKTYINGR